MAQLVQIAPLEDAVKQLGAKSPVASKLRTKDWAKVPAEIRNVAQFSAGVEDANFLAIAQEKLRNVIALQRERVKNGEALVNRDSFIADLRELALPISDSPNPFADQGVGNIASRARLGLIFDMQTQMAQGFADWKLGNDADVLDAFPAQELLPSTARKPRAEWDARWAKAGGPNTGGRLVALKTDPVWAKLSRFGTPWPPFDFGSTRDLRDVSRDEAERLGLIKPGARVKPAEVPPFDRSAAASAAQLPPEFIAQLKRVFGQKIALQDGQLVWKGSA